MPYLRLADPQLRLFQTYCSLICWIRETRLTKIVLCDNTGTSHAFSELSALAAQHDKDLEVLVFRGDHKRTCLRGKGYGEGETMKHVMTYSRFLREDTEFYKVTARVFVENFDALTLSCENKGVVFDLPTHLAKWKKGLLKFAHKYNFLVPCLKYTGKGSVATTFYKCNRQYYTDNLISRFREVDDRLGHYLEQALLVPLMEKGFDIFSTQPCLVGQSATEDCLYGSVDYSDEVKKLAAHLLGRESKEATPRTRTGP